MTTSIDTKKTLNWEDLKILGLTQDKQRRYTASSNAPEFVKKYLENYRTPSAKWPFSHAKALMTAKFAKILAETDKDLAVKCGLIEEEEIRSSVEDYKEMTLVSSDAVEIEVIDETSGEEAIIFVSKEVAEDNEELDCFIHNYFLIEMIQQKNFRELEDALERDDYSSDLENFKDSKAFYKYCVENKDARLFFELADKVLGVMSDHDIEKFENNMKLSYSMLR